MCVGWERIGAGALFRLVTLWRRGSGPWEGRCPAQRGQVLGPLVEFLNCFFQRRSDGSRLSEMIPDFTQVMALILGSSGFLP